MRAQIIRQAMEFFRLSQQNGPFTPGATFLPAAAKTVDAEDLGKLIDASLDMWLTAGRYSDELEKLLPKHFGRTTSALLVNSGSSANLLALSSLCANTFESQRFGKLKPGDEVITAAAGFPTTVNPILQNGLVPVFIDVEFETLNATLDAIKSAKSPQTRAVMLAHTLGNPFRADEVAKWCEENKMYLIEDCCDAFGSKIDNKPVGAFGDYATVSFYPAHHITTGEGGAVFSKNGSLRKVAQSVRDWGRDCWCDPGKDNTCGKRFGWQLGSLPEGFDHKYMYTNLGYNLKITDMQAALGVSQLAKVDGFIQKRQDNYKTLFEGLQNSPILRDRFIPVTATFGTTPSWFGFPIHCVDSLNRSKVVQELERRKVGTRLLFGGNLTCQAAYQNQNFRVAGQLLNSDRIMRQTFWIGLHPNLGPSELNYILSQLEAVAKAQ